MRKWIGLSVAALLQLVFLLGGCESPSQAIGRCTIEVAKAQTRLSHATDIPSAAHEALARAQLELTGTRPSLACREARKAVELVRATEQRASVVYLPVVGDLDYGWPVPFTNHSTSRWDDSGSWSAPSGSSDSGGWSGFGGFGGSDSGSWSSGSSFSSGSDAGGW